MWSRLHTAQATRGRPASTRETSATHPHLPSTSEAPKRWRFRTITWHRGCSIERCRAASAARLAAPVFRWSNRPTKNCLPGCRESRKTLPAPPCTHDEIADCRIVVVIEDRQSQPSAIEDQQCRWHPHCSFGWCRAQARPSAPVFRWSNQPPVDPPTGAGRVSDTPCPAMYGFAGATRAWRQAASNDCRF